MKLSSVIMVFRGTTHSGLAETHSRQQVGAGHLTARLWNVGCRSPCARAANGAGGCHRAYQSMSTKSSMSPTGRLNVALAGWTTRTLAVCGMLREMAATGRATTNNADPSTVATKQPGRTIKTSATASRLPLSLDAID